MKITAICNIQMPGRGIVRRGETIEYPKDRIDERIAANFLGPEESRLKVSAKEQGDARQGELLPKTKAEMLAEQDAERAKARKEILEQLGGVDGVREKLAEFGVGFRSDASEESLCDLLLEQIGE